MKVTRLTRNWQNANTLNRQKTKGYDWWLVGCVFLLCTLGLAFLASSLSTYSQEVYQREFYKQLILGIGLGSILAFFLARLDYHWLLSKSENFVKINYFLLGFLAIFIAFFYFRTFGMSPLEAISSKAQFLESLNFLPIKPHMANGAVRWIDFLLLPNFQPSEFSKIALLLYFSHIFLLNENKKVTWMVLKKPLYALLFTSILILIQPDLGTVILICGIILASMWTTKIPFKIVFYLGFFAIVVALMLAIFTNYRAERINALWDRNSDSATQIRGVQQAISNGGLWGKGYGNSEFKQQPGVLFEQSTDAIISIIGEETGFLGTTVFLSLYGFLLWRGLKIANESPDIGGKSLATGIAIWITSQAIINIAGNLSLLPLKGIPLPFVSQGGSSMLINLIVIGILLNVSKQRV